MNVDEKIDYQAPEITNAMDGDTFIKQYRAGRRNFSCQNLGGIDFTKFSEFTKPMNTYEENAKERIGRINLTESLLRRSIANGSNLRKIYAPRVDFSYSNLEGANFFGAFLDHAQFCGADLSGAHMRNAYLWGANFNKANISEAMFIGAMMDFAKLDGVNARKTSFRFASLSNLSTDENIILDGADFAWAYLGWTENLEKSSLKGARFLQTLISRGTSKRLIKKVGRGKLFRDKKSFIIMEGLKE